MQKTSTRQSSGLSSERLGRLSRALQGYVERGVDYLTPEQHTHNNFAFDRYDMDRSAGMWDNWGFGYGVAVRTRRIGLGPSAGSFYWPGAFGTTWVADPQEGLMATLLPQIMSTNPFYTQVGEDFLTLTYQAISD